MNNNKIRSGSIAVLFAAAGVFGLAACSSTADTETTQEASVDVAADLELARTTVLEALATDDALTQVMLASDVDAPTQKYGLLVMPYVATDAAERVTGTVNVDGGNFIIEAESAATGETWTIDQDGNLAEAES